MNKLPGKRTFTAHIDNNNEPSAIENSTSQQVEVASIPILNGLNLPHSGSEADECDSHYSENEEDTAYSSGDEADEDEIENSSEEEEYEEEEEDENEEEEQQEKNEADNNKIDQANEEKVKNAPPARSYKKRLIIGDGDFSYSTALVKKHLQRHPGLGNAITVSDLASEESLKETYGEKFDENVAFLRAHGVKVECAVNGTEMHLNPKLDEYYPRIHFNFPHDGSNFKAQTLPLILKNFFASAKLLQKAGDRIHMALPKPPIERNQWGYLNDNNKFRKAYIYNIYANAAESGYELTQKRTFGSQRYPGYQHVITGRGDSADVAKTGREYIFTKTEKTAKQICPIDDNNDKKRRYSNESFYGYQGKHLFLAEITTDNDSSDYENDAPTTTFK